MIAKKTREFVQGKNIRFIILGGHKELLPKMKKHLLYPLNKMVQGKFITELNIPLADVLIRSKRVAAKLR